MAGVCKPMMLAKIPPMMHVTAPRKHTNAAHGGCAAAALVNMRRAPRRARRLQLQERLIRMRIRASRRTERGAALSGPKALGQNKLATFSQV